SRYYGWRMGVLIGSCINYTMQVLSSPTRKEIDRAHRNGKWFDIGVLGVHNLRRIPLKRLMLCSILILSSSPLHLFYNSAAIYITATNEFKVFFLTQGSNNEASLPDNVTFTRLSNLDWRAEYRSNIVNFGDLYLAIDDYASHINLTNQTGLPSEKSRLPAGYQLPYEPKYPTGLGEMLFNLTDWLNVSVMYRDEDHSTTNRAIYAHVAGGYATNVSTKSRIQLSLSFLTIVIVCNAIKLATMLWVLYLEKSEFVVTLGDGAASFLEFRDPTTEKFCVFSK
ncbi:hypothetical protein BU23DRAFT_417826, partial [Bimuria novae-zelandiae CBS 107.79]